MKKQNIAYDFSLFESSEAKKPDKKKKNDKNVIKITQNQLYKSRRKKYKPLKVIGYALMSLSVLAIVGIIIVNQIKITEYTEEINAKSKQLEESKSIYTQLKMKVETKLSLKTVEDYAVNILGMKPVEPYQIKYVNMATEDKVEVMQEDSKSWIEVISDSIAEKLS